MLKHKFYPINHDRRVLITLTSYYSYGWTKSCVSMLRKHIPEAIVLVIDNNPSPSDDPLRADSFKRYPYNSIAKPVSNNSMHFFEAERRWYKSQKNLTYVTTPKRLWHGEAIDLAMQYAYANYFEVLVHIEPDCEITGSHWYKNLLDAIYDGAYMSSGVKLPDGSLHPCPSAWLVKENIKHTFMHSYKGSDYFEVQYPKLVDCENSYDFEFLLWDTAKKAWYEHAKKGKATLVKIDDFEHLWGHSSSAFGKTLLM